MPDLTAQKWPAANSRWNSIEDLSLLFHLSLLEANLSPSFTSATRPAENGQLPSITIMANIPGCKHVVLAQVGQPSPQEWVVNRVPLFRTAAIARLQEKSRAVRRGRKGSRSKSKANPKKVLAHGHREEPVDLETYLNRGYIDVGSELLGPTDLTRLEGSLRSCARRFSFKCLPHRRLGSNGGVLVFAQRTRAELTSSQPVIKIGTPPQVLRGPASQAAAPAPNRYRHSSLIKDEEDDDEPDPVEEEELAAESAAHRASTPDRQVEIFSTADGGSTTVSAKGDFLGVWVPKHR
ncbi:BQ5605_C050g12508 [Microbotryum silenes-dioicae]|uniref:BQ5605_C050g12508 protein n=1 Tax=Microbotryum silenes-dioicae TaxID=796604 RepID=A0A2X0PN08_9BASI|nr:BQ5605_C050g12508 [Microbotryum silenes-dioicae]